MDRQVHFVMDIFVGPDVELFVGNHAKVRGH